MNVESIAAALKVIREQQEYCIDHYEGAIGFIEDPSEPLLVERSETEVKNQSE